MSKISNELREYCKDLYKGAPNYMTLMAIADRIDAEMVELPENMDGVPIHVGDTVYLKDGRKYHVSRVNIARDHTSIDVNPCGTGRLFFSIEPTRFTHTRPDSLERIADELDDWKRKAAEKIPCFGLEEDALHALADRIRKLAKEGE